LSAPFWASKSTTVLPYLPMSRELFTLY
jgi:hypothetical protein